MPIYEYQCSKCGHEMEELQTISAPPLIKCPNCGNNSLKKLIGTGGGLIFKGSGFYLTDYKNKSASEKNSKTGAKDTEKEISKSKVTTESSGSKISKHSGKGDVKASAKDTSTKKESKKS